MSLQLKYFLPSNNIQAIESFTIARQVNPGFLPTYVNLGVAYYNNKEIDKAIEMYKIASNHFRKSR